MKKQFFKILCLFITTAFAVNNLFAVDYRLSPASKIQFGYKDVIQTETYYWPKTLVTYPVCFSGGILEKDLVLVNKKTGGEVLFQLSDRKTENGKLIYADFSFMAELPQGGEFLYELSVGKGNATGEERLKVSDTTSGIEVLGEKFGIRLPKSLNTAASVVSAPICAIKEGNSWIGDNKIISSKKKVLSISSVTLDDGPLFYQQSITYKFEGGGEYIAKVKLIKDYPFAILDETMTGLSKEDGIRMDMEWTGFRPVKRFGTQWDRNLESEDAWLDIDKPVYTSYSKEDPRWTGMGWIEDPTKQMIFRISPFGGNSVREQPPVMSFWEDNEDGRELGVFVYDNNRWNDKQYGIWQPTPMLSIYFRYTNDKLYFTYPLISGTRSTALSFFPRKEGEKAVKEFDSKLAILAERGGKHNPKDMFYRYSQLLLMRHSSLSLDRIKDWVLTYPENAKRPENPFNSRTEGTSKDFVKQISVSPMAYYPMGLNYYPGIHSIEHRILFSAYVEDYLRFYKELNHSERQTIESLLIISGYVNVLEEMNAIRNSLAGTANMAADGWAVPAQISYMFPEHPMANEWLDFFEKSLELYGLFYTRPDVALYESNGGRWVESMGVYNWAFLRPTSHSNIAGELFDGKNRFASGYMAARGRWMRDMITAPINIKGRCYPPHGAHGGGYLVSRYSSLYHTAQWLNNYDPILAENLFWTGSTSESLEKKKADTNWEQAFEKVHPNHSKGTNPHLKSTKYTGHGIVLRAGVDTPEELSVHLDQVDKGPNYRWGNQGEGNSGGLYFYAKGKVYAAHENEIAGDHIVNNLDGLTNFGVMKNGDFRTVGMNELKAPLYDFGFSQFAELLSDNGEDKYSWPDYLSRSVMLAGTDYFILFDEVGTNWRAAGRFAWFNANGNSFPKIVFLSTPARKDSWMTAQTPNSRGFYRDNFGSVLTLVTHKKDQVSVEGGNAVSIPLLNDPDINDFKPDKNSVLPVGVALIKTANSRDMIFRNGNIIRYKGQNESFEGKAGLIRRFQDGRIEMSMFKGETISVDGLSVTLKSDKESAFALAQEKTGETEGILKCNGRVSLRIEGLKSGGRLYANGIEIKSQYINNGVDATFDKGTYRIEYTDAKPRPMESVITASEYERNRVKLYVKSFSPCEFVRMEVSYDGGNTWKSKGNASKGIFILKNEDVAKIHVRAVSVNGRKTASSAKEYPVYFTKELPHYPEGLWLKIDHNRVDLSWGEILGTQKYKLYRRAMGDTEFRLIYEGKDRKYSDRGVVGIQKAYALPGTQNNKTTDRSGLVVYEYTVTAVNGNGESEKSPVENTDPSSWRNWYPDTELKFKRQSAFWMEPYVYPQMVPEKYYPE